MTPIPARPPWPPRRGRWRLLTAAALAAACSEPPTTGGRRCVAAGDDEVAALPDCPLDALEARRRAGRGHALVRRPRRADPGDHGRHGGRLQRQPGRGRVINASNQGDVLRRGLPQVPERRGGRSRPAARHRSTSRTSSCRRWSTAARCCPAQACMEADDYDLDAHRAGRPVDTTRSTTCCCPGYMNVSTPVLYYNKAHFAAGRARPRRPARARSTSCTRRPRRSRTPACRTSRSRSRSAAGSSRRG